MSKKPKVSKEDSKSEEENIQFAYDEIFNVLGPGPHKTETIAKAGMVLSSASLAHHIGEKVQSGEFKNFNDLQDYLMAYLMVLGMHYPKWVHVDEMLSPKTKGPGAGETSH